MNYWWAEGPDAASVIVARVVADELRTMFLLISSEPSVQQGDGIGTEEIGFKRIVLCIMKQFYSTGASIFEMLTGKIPYSGY